MVESALVLAQLISAAIACPTQIVGLTPSQADGYGSAELGMAIGQTFYAPSTDVLSLTVWRVAAEDTLADGMHLFICSVDSSGAPHPELQLLDGPTVTVPFGDGCTIEHRFDFDPPFKLPAPGTYAFFLQASPCYGWFDLIADNKNEYPQGSKWQTQRNISECNYLRPFPSEYPTSDLIFRIEFCDQTTPVTRRSWGAIKTIYR
jgi:hypothetical protein